MGQGVVLKKKDPFRQESVRVRGILGGDRTQTNPSGPDHMKEGTMSTPQVQNDSNPGLLSRFAGRIDLRLILLVTCTAISVTTAGLMA